MGTSASTGNGASPDEFRECVVRTGDGPGDHVYSLEYNGFKAQATLSLEGCDVSVNVFSVDERWRKHAVTLEVELRDAENKVVVEGSRHMPVQTALQDGRAFVVKYDKKDTGRLLEGHCVQLKIAITPTAAADDESRVIIELDDERVGATPVIMWFFGSASDAHSEAFRVSLMNFYAKINADPAAPKALEVIYVSCDAEERAFAAALRAAPWLALAHDGEFAGILKAQELQDKAIPHVLVQDDDGETLSADGVADVEAVYSKASECPYELMKRWLPRYEKPEAVPEEVERSSTVTSDKGSASMANGPSRPSSGGAGVAPSPGTTRTRKRSFAAHEVSGTIEGDDKGGMTFTYVYSKEGLELTVALDPKARTLEVFCADTAVRWEAHVFAFSISLCAGGDGVSVLAQQRQQLMKDMKDERTVVFQYSEHYGDAVRERHRVHLAFRATPRHTVEGKARAFAADIAEERTLRHDWVLLGDQSQCAHNVSISTSEDPAASLPTSGDGAIPPLTLHAGFRLVATVAPHDGRVIIRVAEIEPRWHGHALSITYMLSALGQYTDVPSPSTPSETDLLSEALCDKWVLLARESRRFDTVSGFVALGHLSTYYPKRHDHLVRRKHCIRIAVRLRNTAPADDADASAGAVRLCRAVSEPPELASREMVELDAEGTELGGVCVGEEVYPQELRLPLYVTQQHFRVPLGEGGRLTGRTALRERRAMSEVALQRRVGEKGRDVTLCASRRGNLCASLLSARSPPPPAPMYRPSEEEKAELRELLVTSGEVWGWGADLADTETMERRWRLACRLLAHLIATSPPSIAAHVYKPSSLPARLAVATALTFCTGDEAEDGAGAFNACKHPCHLSDATPIDPVARFQYFAAKALDPAGSKLHRTFTTASTDLLRQVIASHIKIPEEADWAHGALPGQAPEHFTGASPEPVSAIAGCLIKPSSTECLTLGQTATLENALLSGGGGDTFSWFGVGVAQAFGIAAVRMAPPTQLVSAFLAYERGGWVLRHQSGLGLRDLYNQRPHTHIPWSEDVQVGDGVAWRLTVMSRCHGARKCFNGDHAAARAGYAESENLRLLASLVLESVQPGDVVAASLAGVSTPTPLHVGSVEALARTDDPEGCSVLQSPLVVEFTFSTACAPLNIRVRYPCGVVPAAVTLSPSGSPVSASLLGNRPDVEPTDKPGKGDAWVSYHVVGFAGAVAPVVASGWTLTFHNSVPGGASGVSITVKEVQIHAVSEAVAAAPRTQAQAAYAAELLRAAVAKCPWNYPAWRDLARVTVQYLCNLYALDRAPEGSAPTAWVASAFRGYEAYSRREGPPVETNGEANGHDLGTAGGGFEPIGVRVMDVHDAEITATCTTDGSAADILSSTARAWYCKEDAATVTVVFHEAWLLRRLAVRWAGTCRATRVKLSVAAVDGEVARSPRRPSVPEDLEWTTVATEMNLISAEYNHADGVDGWYAFSLEDAPAGVLQRATHLRLEMADGVEDTALSHIDGRPRSTMRLGVRCLGIEGVPYTLRRPLRPTVHDMAVYLISRAFAALQRQAQAESAELITDCAAFRDRVEACFAGVVPYFANKGHHA
eukprot:TRINITY_DN18272_c0_g1_i1.p1 TRINITY_DN18272_c0_g1~~TRINITY_DN18272_c0_g1_i1.p1  ORF type:complete len:1577 (+),score=403.96 TRINITY_DN18272_c0_g1_i1:79-4809(+)